VKLPSLLALALALVHTRLTTDPMEAVKKLQNLKCIELLEQSYLGKELVFSREPGNFPQLEAVEILLLLQLKMVVVKEGGMPRLRDFGKAVILFVRSLLVLVKGESVMQGSPFNYFVSIIYLMVRSFLMRLLRAKL